MVSPPPPYKKKIWFRKDWVCGGARQEAGMHYAFAAAALKNWAEGSEKISGAGGYDEIKSVTSSGPSGPYRRGVNILQVRNVPAGL